MLVETKGLVEENVPRKMERLRQWCEDVNAAIGEDRFSFVFVDQKSFENYQPKAFSDVLGVFTKYHDVQKLTT